MKDKILAAIKAKFPAVNLSKTRLNALAAIIEKKVIDDESKIDAALDDLNSFMPLTDLAKEDDRVRNLEAKLKTTATTKTKDDDESDPNKKTPETNDDPEMPKWARAMMEQNKNLLEKVASIEKDKTRQTLQEKIGTQLKDVPKAIWSKRQMPEKEEDIENFVAEVRTDFEELVQQSTDNGLSLMRPPGNGTPDPTKTTKDKNEKVDPALVKYLDKTIPAKEASIKKEAAKV
jgi:hypothetical protein